jgi:hypothetical protein
LFFLFIRFIEGPPHPSLNGNLVNEQFDETGSEQSDGKG